MSKWKCGICNIGFDNYQAQGFDGVIYCPLCYFKELYKREKQENQQLKENYDRIYNENCKLREEHNITDISLLDENQQLKKQKDDGIKYIKEHIKYECDNAFNGMQFYSYHLYDFNKEELLRMLGEIDVED